MYRGRSPSRQVAYKIWSRSPSRSRSIKRRRGLAKEQPLEQPQPGDEDAILSPGGGHNATYMPGNGELLRYSRPESVRRRQLQTSHQTLQRRLERELALALYFAKLGLAPSVLSANINYQESTIAIRMERWGVNLEQFLSASTTTESDAKIVARKLVMGIRDIARHGVFLGDINGRNVVIKDNQVRFIDFDNEYLVMLTNYEERQFSYLSKHTLVTCYAICMCNILLLHLGTFTHRQRREMENMRPGTNFSKVLFDRDYQFAALKAAREAEARVAACERTEKMTKIVCDVLETILKKSILPESLKVRMRASDFDNDAAPLPSKFAQVLLWALRHKRYALVDNEPHTKRGAELLDTFWNSLPKELTWSDNGTARYGMSTLSAATTSALKPTDEDKLYRRSLQPMPVWALEKLPADSFPAAHAAHAKTGLSQTKKN